MSSHQELNRQGSSLEGGSLWQKTGGQCCSYSRSQQPLVALVGNSIFLSLLTKRRFWLPQLLCAGTVVLMTVLYAVFMTPWNENSQHKEWLPETTFTTTTTNADGMDVHTENGVFVNAAVDSAGKLMNVTLPFYVEDSPEGYVSVFGKIGKTLHIRDVLYEMALLLVAQGLLPQIAMGFQLILHAVRYRKKAAELSHDSGPVQGNDCCCCYPNISAQFQLAGTGCLIMFMQLLAFYSFSFYVGNVSESLTPAGTVQRAVSALFIQQVPNNMFSYIKKMHPKLAHQMVESVKALEQDMADVEHELEERRTADIEMGGGQYMKMER
jgi:hypothetical protein